MHVFAVLCMKMFVNCMFCMLVYISLIIGICMLYVFLQVVKRFESPKTLDKFPVVLIIILL